MGGISLATAQYISQKNQVTFVLVSRHTIDGGQHRPDYIKQKNELIEQIKANGSLVYSYCADIGDSDAVNGLIARVKTEHGDISGIIHTAGVAPLALEKHSVANIRNAFKGKIYGLENVIDSAGSNQLKFIACTSSLASLMGDINRIEYCASNSYLDCLTADRVRFKNTKVISVNWPAWSDIGMVRGQIMSGEDSLRPLKGIERLMHLNAIEHNDGAEIFYRLINQSAHGQVAVSKLNLKELKCELFKPAALSTPNSEITILESDHTDNQYKAAQIFCNVLGLETLSIHDDFFRIGGNSI